MEGREYLISTIRRVRESRRIALCGYFLAGFPTPAEFYALVRAAQRLDVVEFGIPSSKPWLDGPTIATAHAIAVGERGLNAETALALLGGLQDIVPPRFVMTYAEEGRNYRGFLRSCLSHKIQGVFAPDLGSDEAQYVAFSIRLLDLAFVQFVDLTMTIEATNEAIMTSDIVYLRVGLGCTGGSATLCDADCHELKNLIRHARLINPQVLIAGGIGIRNPNQVASLACLGVDMAIVGTALVEKLNLGVEHLAGKVDELREATQAAPG